MPDNIWQSTSSTDYSVAGNWSLGAIPSPGDDVWLEAGAANIVSGLGQSAVVLNSFTAMDGYTGTVGSSSGYLEISLGSADRLTWYGTGLSYIDLNTSSSPDVVVHKTFVPQTGHGLYLLGDTIDEASIFGGNVGIAALPGETATVASVTVGGDADVFMSAGVTNTSTYVQDGTLLFEPSTTLLEIQGGEVTVEGTGVPTSITMTGGELIYNGTGTIAAMVLAGGHLDLTQSGLLLTITDMKLSPPGSYTYTKPRLTITTWSEPSLSRMMTISAS